MAAVLEHPEGRVVLEEMQDGRRRVIAEPHDPSAYVSVRTCETRYPAELIERILDAKGISYVCNEIARDEDPRYVERFLRHAMLAYVAEEQLRGKRLLDFGSGSGASTMILARLFPNTEIVGVDILEDELEIARLRARFYGLDRVRFVVSPAGDRLPEGLGDFDFISFSAVYEHLLPAERPVVLAQVWSALRPGGILFVNQTPQRWYPHEYHTTGLPLLNYLPDRLAWRLGRRLSSRVEDDASWERMLRDGIRGGTERELIGVLRAAGGGTPVSLRPTGLGLRDTVDLWYAYSMAGRPSPMKPAMRAVFKAVSRVSGQDFTPSLDLAIQKR